MRTTILLSAGTAVKVRSTRLGWNCRLIFFLHQRRWLDPFDPVPVLIEPTSDYLKLTWLMIPGIAGVTGIIGLLMLFITVRKNRKRMKKLRKEIQKDQMKVKERSDSVDSFEKGQSGPAAHHHGIAMNPTAVPPAQPGQGAYYPGQPGQGPVGPQPAVSV